MTPETQTKKKDKLTFTGLLFILYFSLLACDNKQAFLYGGYIIIAGLIIVDKLFSQDRLKIEFPTACKCLYYFTVFCYFSRFWAWNEYLVVNYAKFLVPIMIFMVICVNYFIKIRSTKACLYAISFSGLALSVYGIVKNGGFASFYALATQEGNRIGTGGDMNVNAIGMICAYSVVVLIYYAMFKKRYLCYIISVLPFMTSVATGSRKSIILIVVGILTLMLLSQKDKKGIQKYIKLFILLLILCVGIQFVLSLDIMSTVRMRMEIMLDGFFGSSTAIIHNESTRMRAQLIKVGWQQFKETPFIGVGFGNARVANWNRMGVYAYSHNDYIEHLVNGGIVSILLYYLTIVYLAVKHIKLMKVYKKPELIISFTTIVMYFVMGAAAVTYYGSMTTYLYFILWISEVAICEREQYENENKKTLQEDKQQINS